MQRKGQPDDEVHGTTRQEVAPRRTSRTSTTTTATSRAVPGTHRSSIAVPKATGQQDPVPRRDSRAAPTTKATNPKVPQTHRPSVAVPKMTSRERDKEMTRMTEDMNDNKATTAQRKASALKEQPYSDKTSPPKKDGDAHGSRYATKAVYRFYTYATVAAASAVIFALVYAAFWMLRGRVTNDGVQCRTKECKEAAEYLKNLTVAAYTPCSDFYDRVCGTWTAPGAGFQVDLLKDLLRTLNASMFETRVPQDAESQRLGMHVLLPLYRGCYRYMQHVSNIRDEVANAEAAVNVNEVRRATSFSDIVRFVVRTSLQLGFFTIFDVRFVHEGDRDMLELRRGYSLQAKVGSQGASDAKFRISKLVSSWLGIDNATKETELLFRIDAKVQTAFAQHLPESRSTLRDVTEGLLTLSADEWVKAINDAHNVTTLKVQASDSVIDTNMASDSSTSPLHRVSFCVYLVRTCFAATWPLLASKVLGDKTSTPALERIFTGLQQAAKTPQALTWMDDKEREVASAIVSNTSLLVVSSTMPTVSKPDYTGPTGSFEDDPDAFLLTYARARRHHYNVRGDSIAQQAMMLSLSAGARLAYAAMEADFRERVGGNEELAQKWWPDVQETFFMRFCLTWCSSIRAPVPLTYEEMCLLPLYNMKEFGARYGCKSNSTYSAGPMCDV
ncbi:hypothetical protein HPB51_025177 [Rhipicephalus microplus]|uniref:Uncharacterized protein n=1 Tax=Rhipicephalus microplus TaxID=6941 RepID=A0A9J6E5G3_RHIMP|nr:hypothetical protein HPB51_025177 [Rhipicephalus microplus]